MRSKYQGYAVYKTTHSKWISEIPAHWLEISFKRVVDRIKDGTHGTHDRVDDGVPFLSAKNVHDYGVNINDSESNISLKDHEEIVSNGFPQKGDLLITCVGTIGRSCVYQFDRPYSFQRSVSFLRLTQKAVPEFYKYFVQSKCYQSQLEAQSKASAQSGIYMGDLINTSTVLVSVYEQEKIASFLDHETTNIDTLIEKQQQLIKLLKEKRQAVISHAVTKGLNPDAPMKDSGIEWLGEVPEHWIDIKLKHIVIELIDAEHKTAPFYEHGEYLVCRTTNVRNGKLRLEGGKYTDLETFKKWTRRGAPEAGDVLFTREAPAGEACIVPQDTKICLGQRMVLFKVSKKRFDSKFLLFSLYAGLADEFVKQLSQGSTVAHFNMADIKNIPLFNPPLPEQVRIVEYLNSILEKYDVLTTKASRSIDLMQERRTALISAAVTGKIDVRNWQLESSPPCKEAS